MGLFDWIFGRRKLPRDDDGRRDDSRVSRNVKTFKPEWVVVGLGNPGEKYAGTRHNIGFDVVNELVGRGGRDVVNNNDVSDVSDPKKTGGVFDVSAMVEMCEAFCWTALCGRNRTPVLLAKPFTYMNLSGDAVAALLRKFNLTIDKCVVIVDDFNIPLGKTRVRKDGSHGGHNGLRSISANVGDNYPRVRVGIGPKPKEIAVIEFVLGKFCDDERGDVDKVIKTAADAVVSIIDDGIDASMNRFN